MPDQPPRKPRKPKGQALPLTEQDLDQLSEVKAADLKGADALWERDAPTWAKNLLNAKPEEPDDGGA